VSSSRSSTEAAAAGTREAGCLVCGSVDVEEFLDLGSTGLANRFRSESELGEPEDRYPLRVGSCAACGHVQLLDRVPPAAMFSDYLYVSSASDTLRGHLHELSDLLVARHGLGSGDLVVDIGCNDGTLLEGFARHGVRTLGVDPAENLAELRRNGVERYVGFFGAEIGRLIAERWGPASLVTATNTFPHIPALDDFFRGIDTLLATDGLFVVEAHYLVDLLEQRAFDTIYHEHVSYWALGPMRTLFERYGLEIVDAERLPIHHGQLRVTAARRGCAIPSERVGEVLRAERDARATEPETLRRFADAARAVRADLHRLLGDLRAQRKRVAGYGAPAKGNTLLSFLSLGPDDVEYIADRSPLKQGLYTPNAPIPVVAPERLLEDMPDYVVLFAWNFEDEILEQQAEYRRRGGRFIVPVPEVRIV
jgi:SAM-dependent methyltransferase